MSEDSTAYDAGENKVVDLEHPDTATPAYALRELANWIEHRTGGIGEEQEPRDESRIKLGRKMADALDKMFEVHSNTIAALHEQLRELEDFRTIHAKLDRILATMALQEVHNQLIGGADMAAGADETVLIPFQVPVAKTPVKPVEAHQCSTLEFHRDDQMLGTRLLTVRCDLGRETDIDMEKLVQMAANPQVAIMEIARRIAAEHELDVNELFDKMRKHSIGDLKTITVGTSSLPTPLKG